MDDSPEQRYREIRDVLQQSILRDYPNPERRGCPGRDTLRKIARRPRPIRDADWDHVTHCSPCYREFLELRADLLEAEHQRKSVRRSIWIAASLLALAGLLLYRGLLERNAPSRVPPSSGSPSQERATQPVTTAVLNLESQSETRGEGQPRPAGPPQVQRLPRKAIVLSVYLPLGSEPGQYEIRLLKSESDAGSIASWFGSAAIENGLTVLRVSADLSHLEAGVYVIALRRGAGSWRYFRVALN
jgi:hypothetical protein